jgi:hypothetical protein
MRRPLLAFTVAALLGGALSIACGAENLEAPKAEPKADLRACQAFDQLMPNFVAAIDQGRTQNLKTVVEAQLLKPLREGDSPPVADVLRAIFASITSLALKPPEAGAPMGQACAATAPPLSRANELCEVRRALDVLVHQGKGIESVTLLEPQLSIALGYLGGTGFDCRGRPRTTPHFEISNVISNLCTQDANCQVGTGLDLAIGATAYLQTPEGKLLITHLDELANKQSIIGLLAPSNLTEDQAVALARGLIPVVQSADAATLVRTFDALPLPAEVRRDLDPVVGDLKVLLNHPEVLEPARRSLTCIAAKDKNDDIVRSIYRLAIAEQCESYGLSRLTATARGLQEVDTRGSLLFVAHVLASSIRADETAIDSAALVCRTLFSTATVPGQARSNAALALPVIADLLEHHVLNEAICAADTLVFGCAGGPQPACR